MTPLQEIERDLDWRDAELAVLKIMLANDSLNDREKLVLFRAAWSLLYAHYEGFCKFALTVYYDTLQHAGKCHRDLPAPLQALALDQSMKTIRSLPTVDLIAVMAGFEAGLMGQPAQFPDVSTDSNLWPSTLRDLLASADINLNSLEQNNRSLATLVSRRNKIAHGERDIIPEFSYYMQYEDAVRTVMYDLAISIDDRLSSLIE